MRSLHLEIIHEGDHCPASFYMAQAVEEILPVFDGNAVRVTSVKYKESKEAANRLIALSISLFGEAAFHKGMRLAPIPSLFIDGCLVFDSIPQREELIQAVRERLESQGVDNGKNGCPE